MAWRKHKGSKLVFVANTRSDDGLNNYSKTLNIELSVIKEFA